MILKIIIAMETITLIYALIKWWSCSFTLNVLTHYLDECNILPNEEEIKKAIVSKIFNNSLKNN